MQIDPPPSLRGSNDNEPSPRLGRVFRKLWPRDAGAFTAHLLRLDPEQRALRFGHGTRTDWVRSVTLGCWIAGDLRGVMELKRLGPFWSRSAEIALSVERAFESRGIGTELLKRGLVIARNRGIASAHMLCLPENHGVRRIVRALQPQLTFTGDQIECEIELDPPDPLSVTAEFCDDGCALMWSLWDWQRGLSLAA
jgi:GNAT superfamily N-acetyltransferase